MITLRNPAADRPNSALLEGHRALVTGAASGIGAAVCRAFVAAGGEVVGADVRHGEGILACDVTQQSAIERAFATAAVGGPLTDVVHAAGVASFGPFRDLRLDEWERTVAINLTGSFLVLSAAARHLGRGTSVTLLASVGGLRGDPLWAAYAASKFGVVGLMQSGATELARDGIRVNCVCPGAVESPMGAAILDQNARVAGRSVEEQRLLQAARVPLGALTTPEQVADVCVFLASHLASHVARASIVVNGGGAI